MTEKPMTETLEPIFVSSEWGELKECVYGWTGQFIWPKFLQDAELRPTGGVRQRWFDHQEQNVATSDPEFYRQWSQQVEGAIEFLERQGIVVHLPRLAILTGCSPAISAS